MLYKEVQYHLRTVSEDTQMFTVQQQTCYLWVFALCSTWTKPNQCTLRIPAPILGSCDGSQALTCSNTECTENNIQQLDSVLFSSDSGVVMNQYHKFCHFWIFDGLGKHSRPLLAMKQIARLGNFLHVSSDKTKLTLEH